MAVLWLIAIFDWTIRDSISALAILFYATPPFVLAAPTVALVWAGRRWHGTFGQSLKRATAVLAVICLVQGILENVRFAGAGQPSSETLKVVFWNVCRGHFARPQQIAERASQFDADLLAFAEATSEDMQILQFWETTFPEYSVHIRPGFVVLARGHVTLRKAGGLRTTGEYCRFNVQLKGQELDVLLADIVSSPIRPRGPALNLLFEVLQASSGPTLMVGDLNTPPSSIHFDRWRKNWRRAWDVAGTGYQATWPQPLPVLTLDHVWGNQGITFRRCTTGWSLCSDHRPVIVELSIND